MHEIMDKELPRGYGEKQLSMNYVDFYYHF